MTEKELNQDIFEDDSEVKEPDDIQEGFIAESDPQSRMADPTAKHKEASEDIVESSLDKQLTVLGRKTAQELAKGEKLDILVPIDRLSPEDKFVTAGINGWNFQIQRDKRITVPVPVYNLLVTGGYNPTVVR